MPLGGSTHRQACFARPVKKYSEFIDEEWFAAGPF
jgi:hypothetical protein